MARKKVVVEHPRRAQSQFLAGGVVPEAEALEPIADIVNVESGSADALIQAASDADGIVVTWGIPITRDVIKHTDVLRKRIETSNVYEILSPRSNLDSTFFAIRQSSLSKARSSDENFEKDNSLLRAIDCAS